MSNETSAQLLATLAARNGKLNVADLVASLRPLMTSSGANWPFHIVQADDRRAELQPHLPALLALQHAMLDVDCDTEVDAPPPTRPDGAASLPATGPTRLPAHPALVAKKVAKAIFGPFHKFPLKGDALEMALKIEVGEREAFTKTAAFCIAALAQAEAAALPAVKGFSAHGSLEALVLAGVRRRLAAVRQQATVPDVDLDDDGGGTASSGHLSLEDELLAFLSVTIHAQEEPQQDGAVVGEGSAHDAQAMQLPCAAEFVRVCCVLRQVLPKLSHQQPFSDLASSLQTAVTKEKRLSQAEKKLLATASTALGELDVFQISAAKRQVTACCAARGEKNKAAGMKAEKKAAKATKEHLSHARAVTTEKADAVAEELLLLANGGGGGEANDDASDDEPEQEVHDNDQQRPTTHEEGGQTSSNAAEVGANRQKKPPKEKKQKPAPVQKEMITQVMKDCAKLVQPAISAIARLAVKCATEGGYNAATVTGSAADDAAAADAREEAVFQHVHGQQLQLLHSAPPPPGAAAVGEARGFAISNDPHEQIVLELVARALDASSTVQPSAVEFIRCCCLLRTPLVAASKQKDTQSLLRQVVKLCEAELVADPRVAELRDLCLNLASQEGPSSLLPIPAPRGAEAGTKAATSNQLTKAEKKEQKKTKKGDEKQKKACEPWPPMAWLQSADTEEPLAIAAAADAQAPKATASAVEPAAAESTCDDDGVTQCPIHDENAQPQEQRELQARLQHARRAAWRLTSTRRVVAARALLAGCGMDLFMHDAAVAALAVADLAGQARAAYFAILEDPTLQHMLASTVVQTHDRCTSEALAAAAGNGSLLDPGMAVASDEMAAAIAHIRQTVAGLSLPCWAARCGTLQLEKAEQWVMAWLCPQLSQPAALPASLSEEHSRNANSAPSQKVTTKATLMTSFELFRQFCARVACRPFYVVTTGMSLQVPAARGGKKAQVVGEFDVVVLDATTNTPHQPPLVLVIAEVKNRPADVVAAQHQRVKLSTYAEGCAPSGRGLTGDDRPYCVPSAADSAASPACAALAVVHPKLPFGSLLLMRGAGAIPRWFYVISGKRPGLDLSSLPSSLLFPLLNAVTKLICEQSKRPLNSVLRFHRDYFTCLGGGGASGAAVAGSTEQKEKKPSKTEEKEAMKAGKQERKAEKRAALLALSNTTDASASTCSGGPAAASAAVSEASQTVEGATAAVSIKPAEQKEKKKPSKAEMKALRAENREQKAEKRAAMLMLKNTTDAPASACSGDPAAPTAEHADGATKGAPAIHAPKGKEVTPQRLPLDQLTRFFDFQDALTPFALEVCSCMTHIHRNARRPNGGDARSPFAVSPLHVIAELLLHSVLSNIVTK